MTNYKMKCEQPTIKCRFKLVKLEEYLLELDLTIPELSQIQKSLITILEFWEKKNPNGDKESYNNSEIITTIEIENKNPAIKKEWLPLVIQS